MENPINLGGLEHIDIKRLPPQIKQLIQLIGITQTYHFLKAFGGKRLNIPKTITRFDHPIALVIGMDDSNILCNSYWHQMQIEVPSFNTLLHSLRVSLICADHPALSINELVEKYHLTHKYIRNILNQCPKCTPNPASTITKTPQLDLFEAEVVLGDGRKKGV